MEKDLFPWLGSLALPVVTAPILLHALRKIEARGAINTAHDAREFSGQVFMYVIATGRPVRAQRGRRSARRAEAARRRAHGRADRPEKGRRPASRHRGLSGPADDACRTTVASAHWTRSLCVSQPSLGRTAHSDNTLNTALRHLGFARDDMKAHGFRATARTIMVEKLGIAEAVIEAALAHAKSWPMKGAYDRTEFMDQRRVVAQRWADYLDTLRAAARS
ncbi:MAG: hypothetical protein ABI699_02720 [Caldimonas sp.]